VTCPIFSSYAKEVRRDLQKNAGLYLCEHLGEEVEDLESQAKEEACTPAVSRLRAFYLVQVACRTYCVETMRRVYTQLVMEQRSEESLVLLARQEEMSWKGLTRVIEAAKRVKEEIEIEITGVHMDGQAILPMLSAELKVASAVLTGISEAAAVVREELNHEDVRPNLQKAVRKIVGVERASDVAITQRVSNLSVMLHITAGSTVFPTGTSRWDVVGGVW